MMLISILMMIAGGALIILDLFVLNIPSVLCAIDVIFLLVFTSLYIFKKKKSKAARITIGCLAGLISVIVLFFGYFYPYWNSTVYKNFSHVPVEYDSTISKEDALEDLSVMMSRLRKTHPLLVRGLTPEVKEKYEEALHYIENNEELYLYELDRVLEPIASALHDAHTEVNPVYATRKSMCRIYPHNMDGYRVKKINGISIEDLLDQHRDLYSFEREDWGLSILRGDISTLEGLTMLGIDVSSGVTYTYLTPDGEYVDDVAYPDDYWTIDRINEYYQIEDEYVPFCSYEIDKEKSLAIFTLRSCTYNDEYRNCLKEMFTKVKEEGIENVAFDIRGNGGGSSMVANELLKYLPIDRYKCIDSKDRFGPLLLDLSPKEANNKRYNELTFEGKFFLLVDKYSFSSARNISELIKDNNLGTLIGESLSNSTDCCGNLVRFRLPNSAFSLNVSHTKYNRPDENCEEVFVLPDIECDSDDAMEVLYGLIGDEEDNYREEVKDDQTNVTPENRPVKISEDFPRLYSIDDLKSSEATKDLYFTDLNKQVEPKNVLVLVFNYNNGEFDSDDEWIETAWGDYIFGHGTIPEKTASINDFYKEMSGGKFYLSPVLLGDNKTGVYSIRLDKDYSDEQFVHPEYKFFDFSYDLALVMSELAEKGLDIERYTIPGIDGSNYQRILMENWNAPQSERTKERFSLDGIICVYPPINMESTDLTPIAFDFEHFGLYAHVNHDSSFGTIAHEIGHLLGAVDIYKYNYVYNDLMSYGYDPENEYSVSHVDPYYKMIWGWTDVKLADKNGTTILSPAYSKDYAPILIPTEDPNQYFLIENRRKGGFDNYLEADRETYYEGVAIWRVDKLALEKIYTKERKGLSLEAVLNYVGEEFDLQIYKDFENVDTTGLKDTGIHISYTADMEDAAVIQISGLSE